MTMIDITMTAIASRPDILTETLVSIKSNIKTDRELRLIIDIAPCIFGKRDQYDILQIVSALFEDKYLIYRILPESLQAEAIKWAWSTSDANFIIHWEDDWIATQTIDLDLILPYFKMESLAMIYLDRAYKSVKDYPGYVGVFEQKFFDLWFRYKGKSLAGPPAILRKEYIKDILPIIKDKECLDLTSRTKGAQEKLKHWNIAVYTGEDNQGSLIRDIGKPWRKKHNLKMVKDTPRGVTWVRD